MRELQFAELYNEALRLQAVGDIAEPANSLVLQAYRKTWLLGRSFQYYKDKEPPILFADVRISRLRYFYFKTKGVLRRFLSRKYG